MKKRINPPILQTIQPKKLFLIDSIGALLSAFFLGVVLVRWESHIGMPAHILYTLATIALLFSLHSLYCFLRYGDHWKQRLKIVAIANLLYCSLTLALVIYFYHPLTILGVVYFIVEIIVVVMLSFID